MSHKIPVAKKNELSNGCVIRREFNGTEIAIFQVNDQYFAINAQCPHRGGPLDEADLEDGTIAVCPWHGWRFDITTGKSPTHPAQVSCHTIDVDGEDLVVGE